MRRRAINLPVVLLGIAGCTTTPPADTTLTEQQEAAIDSAADAAAALGTAAAGVSPTADLQSFLGSFGVDGPDCPVVTIDPAGEETTITLDFGDGCAPALYPDSTFAGLVSGALDVDDRILNLLFDAFSIDDETLSGTFLADYSRAEAVSTFNAALDLTFNESQAISGEMVVSIDEATGVVTISQALVTLTDENDDAFEIAFADLVIDPIGNGNFVPEAGTATFETDNPVPGASSVTLEVEFTSQTPTSGTVLVSIEGGAQFSYTLGG